MNSWSGTRIHLLVHLSLLPSRATKGRQRGMKATAMAAKHAHGRGGLHHSCLPPPPLPSDAAEAEERAADDKAPFRVFQAAEKEENEM